jgi:predicted metal-dependent enzyme (double-stranded beta helix superfamily)
MKEAHKVKRFLEGLITGWLLLAFAALAWEVWAQQPAVPGKVVQAQILVDNDKVTVRRWKFAPGEHSPWHTHSLDHVFVVIHGSTIREYHTDGTIRDDYQETGHVGFVKGIGLTHSFQNAGTDPYEMVSIELKETH